MEAQRIVSVPRRLDVDRRTERLSSVSQRHYFDPEVDLVGEVGPGQVLPDELLSINGMELDLSAEQRVRLSREEVAATFEMFVRLEAVLMAGLCLTVAVRPDVAAPATVYSLHEVGEETRHSRLFMRVMDQLEPRARNPFTVARTGIGHWLRMRYALLIVRRPALFATLVLGGEEIPDLIQKLACEHPDTDPFLSAVNHYHRREEARHLSFARMQVEQVYAEASWLDRMSVRHYAPIVLRELFHMLVHPDVYASVGLPKWRTWRAVRRLPQRRELLHEATRPALAALIDAGAFSRGSVPRAWRRLCNVDRDGQPIG